MHAARCRHADHEIIGAADARKEREESGDQRDEQRRVLSARKCDERVELLFAERSADEIARVIANRWPSEIVRKRDWARQRREAIEPKLPLLRE